MSPGVLQGMASSVLQAGQRLCRRRYVTLTGAVLVYCFLAGYLTTRYTTTRGTTRDGRPYVLRVFPPVTHAAGDSRAVAELTERLGAARQVALRGVNLTRRLPDNLHTNPRRVVRESSAAYLRNMSVGGTPVTCVALVVPGYYREGAALPADTLETLRPASALRLRPTFLYFIDQWTRPDENKFVFRTINFTQAQGLVTSRDPYVAYHERNSRVYMHIARDALVSPFGHIWSRDLYVIPDMCHVDRDNASFVAPVTVDTRYARPVDEVFTLAQVWSRNYYHFNIETLPRLAPYVAFLRENPSIRLHVPEDRAGHLRDQLRMLGIAPERLVGGKYLRARVVYLPQGGGCLTKQNPVPLQMLSNIYLAYMDRHYPPVNKMAVILIERKRNRRLVQHEEIARYLDDLAGKLGLEFVVFSEGHLPTFNETKRLFRRAALVVGPHGAGLSNVVWSRPPTVVVELQCINVIRCFMTMSIVLGHRYFGIPPADHSCIDGIKVNATRLFQVIEFAVLENT